MQTVWAVRKPHHPWAPHHPWFPQILLLSTAACGEALLGIWVSDGQTGLRDCPSVQGGDRHLCSKLNPQFFQISAPSIYTQSGFGWGVLLGMVKVMSALSEFHPKSEEVLVWSGQSSWCGWQGRLGRDRKAEVIAAFLMKEKEILTGLCEIHCCCPWRAPKALPSLLRGRTL